MSTASGVAPAAQLRLQVGADEEDSADLGAALQRGYLLELLSPEELGARHGLSSSTVRKRLLKRGVRLRGIGESLRVSRGRRLERYKRDRGLLDAGDVAERVPCSRNTVLAHAPELDGQRFAGDDWHATQGTLLFPPAAVVHLRSIIAQGKANRAHAKGRTGRPRTGITVECPCGCGRTKYLHPSQTSTRPGYFSSSCWARHRWKLGLAHVEKLVSRTWTVSARRRYLGRWAGRKPPGPGGRPRGAPKQHVPTDKAKAVLVLWRLGVARVTIAKRTGVSEKVIRRLIAEQMTTNDQLTL